MNRITLAIALFASIAVSCAQVAAQEPTQPQEPDKHHEAAPPPSQEPEVRPPSQQQEEPPKRPESMPKPEKQELPQPSKEQKQPAHEEHGTQQGNARPAGKSAHIPDAEFKAHFGKQHPFVVNRVLTTTTIVPNQTQFVYVGYTFIFLEPWPADWLFTDDCYIDYVDDEYFLFDQFHPGVGVALFVVE